VDVSVKVAGRQIKGSPFRISFLRIIGSTGEGNSQFNQPSGVAFDRKHRIFVADSKNHRIQCLDLQGNFLFKFGSKGEASGEFNEPKDVTFNSKTQTVIVADMRNHRVQTFDSEGNFQFAFGTLGRLDGQLKFPNRIATDREGNIYVCDSLNHRIQVFNEGGAYLRKFGTFGKDYGHVKVMTGLGVFSNGEVAVSDRENLRISIFDQQGRFVRAIGENKELFYESIIIDSRDNILVANNLPYGNSTLVLFSKDGKELHQIGKDVFINVFGVAVGQKGELWISGSDEKGYRLFVC